MWSCEEWNMIKGINISHVNIENMGGRDQSQVKIKFKKIKSVPKTYQKVITMTLMWHMTPASVIPAISFSLASHLSPLTSCLDLPSLPSLPPWSFPTHTFITMLGSLTTRSPWVVCQKHKNFPTPKPLPRQLAPCLLMALSTSVQGLQCISIGCNMQEISVSVECFLSVVNNQTSPGLWSLQHRLQGI